MNETHNKRAAHGTTRRGAGLIAAWQPRIDALEQHLPAAMDGDMVGVHQARVATRRLREVTPLAAVVLDPEMVKDVARRIRVLTQSLGAVRELDVTRSVLTDLVADTAVRDALDAHVVALREAARTTLLTTWTAIRRERLRTSLMQVGDALIARDGHAARQAWTRVVAERLTRRSTELGDTLHASSLVYDSERLHAIRIACKKLRYVVEVAAELRLAQAARALRTLKKHQDILGTLHDIDVLGMHANAIDADGLDAVRRDWAQASRLQHAKHLRGRAALIHTADFVHDRMAPRIAARVQPVLAAGQAHDGR